MMMVLPMGVCNGCSYQWCLVRMDVFQEGSWCGRSRVLGCEVSKMSEGEDVSGESEVLKDGEDSGAVPMARWE